MLATTLFVILIAMMLTATLVAINRQSLQFTAGANDRLAALEMAQSGLNRLLDRWSNDAGFASNLDYQDEAHRRSYRIEFGLGQSVNNLLGLGVEDGVPPSCARVIVTGRAGNVEKRIRCVVRKSLFPVGAPVSAAEHDILFQGRFRLNGVKSPVDPSPVKAGLHTNLPGQASDPAMDTVGDALEVEDTSFLSAVTPSQPDQDFSPAVRAQVAAEGRKPNSPRVLLARTDVPKAVQTYANKSGITVLAPPAVPLPLLIVKDTIINADDALLELGDITVLDDATLCINGSVITPRIRGRGSVVVNGTCAVTAGTRTLFAKGGVALVAKDDVRLHGELPDTTKLGEVTDHLQALQTDLNEGDLAGATQSAETLSNSLSQHSPAPELQAAVDSLHEALVHLNQANQLGPQNRYAEAMLNLVVGENNDPRAMFERFIADNRLGDLASGEFARPKFQGLVYGQNVTVSGNFRVWGGLEAREKMNLGKTPEDRVELTYCESYRNLCPSGLGSPYLVSYQEE